MFGIKNRFFGNRAVAIEKTPLTKNGRRIRKLRKKIENCKNCALLKDVVPSSMKEMIHKMDNFEDDMQSYLNDPIIYDSCERHILISSELKTLESFLFKSTTKPIEIKGNVKLLEDNRNDDNKS